MKVQAVILAVLVAMALAATPMVFDDAETSVALGYRSPATTVSATLAAPAIDTAATTVVAPAIVISLPVDTPAPTTAPPETSKVVKAIKAVEVVEVVDATVAVDPLAGVPVPVEAPQVALAPAVEIAVLPAAPAEAELAPVTEPAPLATIDPALFAPAPISDLAVGTTPIDPTAAVPVAVQASAGAMFPEGLDVDASSDMVELVAGSGEMFPAELGNDIDFDADMVALSIDGDIAG